MPLLLSQPSSAPGREGGSAPSPASPPAGESQPGGPASAPPDGGIFGGGFVSLLPFVVIIAFFIWQSRSQQKKQKALEEGIKAGDRVLTSAGMVGKITEVGERTVRLEVAPGVHVTFLKTSIQGADPTLKKDEPKKDEPKSKDKDAKDEPKKDEPKSKDKDAKDK